MKYKEQPYLNYINGIISVLIGNLPEDEKDVVKQKYSKVIEDRLRKLEEKSNLFKKPFDEILNQFFSRELDFIKNLSIGEKLVRYSEDEEYDKLSELSAKAYDSALKSINEGTFLSEEERGEISKKMIDLCSRIKPHNRQKGSMLLSEGLLDLSFSQKKGDAISFRLANYFKEQRGKSTVDEQRNPK